MIDDSVGVKQTMDFSKSHCPTTISFFDSDSEEDDDFLCVSRNGFGLRSGPSTGSSLSPSFATWDSSFDYHRRYDRLSLIAKINKIINENERSVLHAVEVASASVTQLESRTRRLENSMDDLKVCVEYSHGRIGEKLRELESIMKEVHTDVKFLLDNQETAESELQLLKLQHSKTGTKHETKNSDVQATLPHQKPSLSSCKSYLPVLDPRSSAQPVPLLSTAYANLQQQSTHLNLVQAGSEGSRCTPYANLPHLNHPPPQASVLPKNVSLYLNQASIMSSLPPHESYYSYLVHPCFTSPRSQYTPNCQEFVPYAESGRDHEQLTPSLPQALPRASFLDADESGSVGEVRKTSNEGIVEEVIAMGFRRDLVLAEVKKMKQKQESVDLITLLDKLMT